MCPHISLINLITISLTKRKLAKKYKGETDDVFKNFYDLIGIELDDSLDYYLDHTPWSDLSIPTDFIDEQTYFIHVLRDGEDVSKSIKLQYWGPNTTYTSQKKMVGPKNI